MEREAPGVEAEAVDEAGLVREGIELCKAYVTTGEEIPKETVESLQASVASLPEGRFKDFRRIVGNAAVQGKFLFGGEKEGGPTLMAIFFGERDAHLLENVLFLSRTMCVPVDFYTITNMLRLQEQFQEWVGRGKLAELEEDKARELRRAGRELRQFLSAAGGPEIREKMLIDEESVRQARIREELETQFLQQRTSEALKEERGGVRDEIDRAWRSFKLTSFENAAPVVSRVLFLQRQAEELTRQIEEGDKSTTQEKAQPLSDRERDRIAALISGAKRLREAAEDVGAKKATTLLNRAAEYEQEADHILISPSHKIGGGL